MRHYATEIKWSKWLRWPSQDTFDVIMAVVFIAIGFYAILRGV